jgi:hypothetical protein
MKTQTEIRHLTCENIHDFASRMLAEELARSPEEQAEINAREQAESDRQEAELVELEREIEQERENWKKLAVMDTAIGGACDETEI